MKRAVTLYIPGLDIGGAERQFLELVKGLDKEKWAPHVITNYLHPSLHEEVGSIPGIELILLNKGSSALYPFKLLAALSRPRPEIIHAYLLSAQAYTLLVRPFLPRVKVLFSVRDAMDYTTYHGSKGGFFRRVVENSSGLVDGYIFNSSAGRSLRKGLAEGKVHVIPNGIDTDRFSPDPFARDRLRDELGIARELPVVGIVANFSKYKGYDTFIAAARLIATRHPTAHFVAIGNQATPLGVSMGRLVVDLSLSTRFHFLGPRRDVDRLIPGFDLLCSSSVTEGFSNSICEGMSCGIPCVVTDVGDSSHIVGETGVVVPPRKSGEFAAGMNTLLQLSREEREHLGDAARKRILTHFSIERMVASTEQIYEDLLKTGN